MPVVRPLTDNSSPAEKTAWQDGHAREHAWIRGILSRFPLTQQYLGMILNPQTSAEKAAGVTPVNYAYAAYNVLRYGNNTIPGTTDMLTAFTNALSSASISTNAVFVPAGNYRLSSGITVPAGVLMYSDCFLPSNPSSGTTLTFDLNVPTCVTIGGSGNNNSSVGMRGMSVIRSAGLVPAGSIGILVQDAYNVTLQDLLSNGHARNWRFFSSTASLGISADGLNLHSGAATDVHWEFDGWPEARIIGGRTGQNGSGDVNCNAYVRFQGGFGVGGSGPNTITYIGHQFNQGVNSASFWLNFNNPANPSANAVEWKFIGCHIEAAGAGITSNSLTTNINRLQITSCLFNIPSSPFFSLNSATQITDWTMTGNIIFCSNFNLAPTPQINRFSLIGNSISGSGSITGSANSTTALQGNSWNNGLTLAGGAWGALTVSGEMIAGTITLTATGSVSIDVPGQYFSWTPGLAFGGGSTGITYSRQSGSYQIIGNKIFAEYSINLTSKGTATGAATLTGLPVASNSGQFSGGPGDAPIVANMTGLTGAVKTGVGQGLATASFFQSSASGESAINDTVFTNTTTITGTISYLR